MRIRDNLTDPRARGSGDAERAGADFSHEESQPRGKNNSFRENEETRGEGETCINLGSTAKPNPPLGSLTPLALACLCTKTLTISSRNSLTLGNQGTSPKETQAQGPRSECAHCLGAGAGSSLLWPKVQGPRAPKPPHPAGQPDAVAARPFSRQPQTPPLRSVAIEGGYGAARPSRFPDCGRGVQQVGARRFLQSPPGR